MRVKRASLLLVGLLFGSTALAPLAAADGGLVVLMFITPPGKDVGDTVTVNVESYLNGALADVDSLDVSIGFGGSGPLTFTNDSAGKYHADYTIAANDTLFGSLLISGTADLGAATATLFDSYTLAAGGVSTGWTIKSRLIGHPQGGFGVAAGSTVTVEARAYNHGALEDGGAVNMSYVSTTGSITAGPPMGSPTPVNTTKVSAGVYQGTITVPATVTTTTIFMVTATMGTGLLAPSDEQIFFVSPFRVVSVITASTATSGSLDVYVGDDAAIAGAQVELSGMSITLSFPPQITTVGPFTATTNANGKASVAATWSAMQSIATWNLNVTSGGKLVQTVVSFGGSTSSSWSPSPPIGYGCEANVQTNPGTLKPGQTGNLVFRVTQDGSPVASASIGRYVYVEGAAHSTAAGNVTTDASGNFSMSFTVPNDWSINDHLNVEVYCPSGQEGSDRVSFTPVAGGIGTGAVTLQASGKLGQAVTVTATYTGTNPLLNAQAFVAIVPGNMTTITGNGLAGGGLIGTMTRSSNTWTGSVTVPAWLGEGDYTVLVVMSNDGATSSSSSETTEGSSSVIHLSPQGTTGGNNPPAPAKGFLPGFEGPASVAAVAAVGAVLVAVRRRRAL